MPRQLFPAGDLAVGENTSEPRGRPALGSARALLQIKNLV
jgi:hypothetical protein